MEKITTDFQIPYHNKSKSYYAWVKAGYELFALEGPEGIQIERLSRILDLNKSGFYHYFGNHDTYFQHLMHHHQHEVDLLVVHIRSTDNLMPDCLQYLADFAITILIQKQLQRVRHLPLFDKTNAEVNSKVDTVILPLWADFIEIPDNPTLALKYLELVRNTFYTRVTPETLNFEFIHDICIQAKEICAEFKNSYNGVVVTRQSA